MPGEPMLSPFGPPPERCPKCAAEGMIEPRYEPAVRIPTIAGGSFAVGADSIAWRCARCGYTYETETADAR